MPPSASATRPATRPRPLLAALVALVLAAAPACRDAPHAAAGAAEPVTAPRTTAEARAAFRADLDRRIAAPLTAAPDDEAPWLEAFWAMGLRGRATDTTRAVLARAFEGLEGRSRTFQRAALEAAYGLHPDAFAVHAAALADTVVVPKLYAMAALYLARADTARRGALRSQLARRFPAFAQDPILASLDEDLARPRRRQAEARPPLADLVGDAFAPGRPVVYSFQRTDRRYPGLAVVRGADGRFVRDAGGVPVYVPQLALAASDLPGYLTNGNTPQGVLAVLGTGRSDNVFIGPTPTLVLALPHEAALEAFFGDATLAGAAWSEERYAALLPPSWRRYAPMREAYRAGAAGRTETIAHGTTIDPAFSAGRPFAPNTPSLGCLTALEQWSPDDGRRLASDQDALLRAYAAAGGGPGYYVVVELDDQAAPITLPEVRALLE